MLTKLRPFLAMVAICLIGPGGPAAAQLADRQSEFYKDWISTADRAESVIEANRASIASLEKLRLEINDYRDDFNHARNSNADRIQTLENQVKALGTMPEEGESEPDGIADLRSNLDAQLDSLRVPRIFSQEAYSRANGLIIEIDQIIRDRQRKKLLERGFSPLNPVHWGPAWTDVSESARGLFNETVENVRSDVFKEHLQDRGVQILLLATTIACVLLLYGHRWSEKGVDYLRGFGGAGRGVWTFIVSLLRIFLPWIGVVLLVNAVIQTGVLGFRGSFLFQEIPYWAAILFYFDWIGRQVYLMGRAQNFKYVSAARFRELRVYIDLLAVMLILHEMAVLFQQVENVSGATRAVVGFPVIVLSSLLLLRIRRVHQPVNEAEADEVQTARAAGFSQVIELIRHALFLLGIATPLLAAIGFINAAEAIVFPTIKTLALIAALAIFQRFLAMVYGWIMGQGEAAQDSLFSVLVGFMLVILSLPILALYWGARESDLREAWSRVLQGFDIGGVTISPSNFLTFVAVFVIGYMLTRLLQGGLRNSLLPKTGIDPGGQNAIAAGTGYVGVFVAALAAIMVAGFDLSSLAIVAGALSVGIGFGLQTIVSNFVSGIILLVERPISKGDWIDVNGRMGYVRDISVRSTRIETFDRMDVIVPNSDLISGVVTNYTRGNTIGRVIVPVGVAYGTDTRRVETILLEIANAHPMVLANPAPKVVFQGFGADSLDFEIRAILQDVNWVLSVKSDMNHEINHRFVDEGIEIPFAQRDVWLRNAGVLRGAEARGTEAEFQAQDRPADRRPDSVDLTEADLTSGEGEVQ